MLGIRRGWWGVEPGWTLDVFLHEGCSWIISRVTGVVGPHAAESSRERCSRAKYPASRMEIHIMTVSRMLFAINDGFTVVHNLGTPSDLPSKYLPSYSSYHHHVPFRLKLIRHSSTELPNNSESLPYPDPGARLWHPIGERIKHRFTKSNSPEPEPAATTASCERRNPNDSAWPRRSRSGFNRSS